MRLACSYPLKYVIHCKYLQSSKDQVAVLSCVTLILTYFVLTRGCSGKKIMRNWLLKLKCDVRKQNHPTVSQNFEENEKSTKRFWANVIFVYGRTCKTIISSNVCESYQAYASVEHSAIRGMYVDPDRLDRSLERSI